MSACPFGTSPPRHLTTSTFAAAPAQPLRIGVFGLQQGEEGAPQNRIGFGQLHLHRCPQPVDFAQTAADQGVLLFPVLVLVVGQGADGNQPVGAGFVQVRRTARSGSRR